MFNPILDELIALEQSKDRLKEVEHDRLIKAAIARQRTRRVDLRISLGDRLISLRHILAMLVR